MSIGNLKRKKQPHSEGRGTPGCSFEAMKTDCFRDSILGVMAPQLQCPKHRHQNRLRTRACLARILKRFLGQKPILSPYLTIEVTQYV